MNYTAVVTTINEPNKAIKEIASRLPLIVIGDHKTPENWEHEGANFYNWDKWCYSYQPPINHYARKNIGYLLAMESGADCIYDTDDDNIPNENWKLRGRECWAMAAKETGWCNVYRYFYTADNIWPRGLPLTKIRSKSPLSDPAEVSSPIHQGLADGSPDVDAIWRLTNGWDVSFKYGRSIHLPPGTWSPFNSQSTWWFKEAFPLMYLPQYCTMRMTDIIRSFVAQRCLWEMGYGIVFHSPSEVVQERNPHDLMKDFEDEIQGYLRNDEIKQVLDGLTLKDEIGDNMILCYLELIDIGILKKDEYYSLVDWLSDIDKVWKP